MTGPGRFLSHPAVVTACRIALAVVLLAAGLTKIGEAGTFALQIRHYRLIPFGLENLVAITLPWIELLMALAILLRWNARPGAVAGAGLMALFVLIVGVSMARGLDIECGCFGTTDAGRVGLATLAENIGLLAVALVGGRRAGPAGGVDARGERP